MKITRCIINFYSARASERLSIQIFDQDYHPVSNAVVHIKTMNKAIIFGSERGKDVALFNGQSDDCGHANVDFDCPSGFFEWYVTANDYYDGNVEKSEFSRQEIISAKGVSFLPSNHNYYATNVIYRKKNPMPMHISVKTLIFTMWKSKRSGLR